MDSGASQTDVGQEAPDLKEQARIESGSQVKLVHAA